MKRSEMFKVEIKTTNDLESILSKLKLEVLNKDENIQSKLAFSALTCVNAGINDNKVISRDICEIYKIVGELITKNYWEQYLKYTRYACNLIIKEKFYEYAKILIDNIQLDKINNDNGVCVCFHLYTKYYFNIFYSSKVKPEEISNYFVKLSEILNIARELKCELFSELYNSAFSSESYVMLIIANHIDHIEPFEKAYNLLMNDIKFPNDMVDNVLIKLTKQVFFFIKHLDFGKNKSRFALSCLKSLMNNNSLKCHKNWNYSIGLYYNLLKLLHNPTLPDFNSSLTEVLEKFLVLFKREDIKQVWFMDLVVTFVQIFDRITLRPILLEKLLEEHLIILINIFKRLIKSIEAINYEKTFWICCKSIRKHLIFKVCQIFLILCDSINKLNLYDKLIEKPICMIVEYTIKIAECFECPKIKMEIHNLLTTIKNIIYGSKNKQAANIGIILLDYALRLPYCSEFIDVLNQLKCYLNLYKLTENNDMYKETIANYVVNLIHHNSNIGIIKKEVLYFYDMEKERTIIETVKSSKMPFQIDNFNRNLLLNLEIEILNRNASSKRQKEALLKICETHLEFALVLRQQNNSLPIIDEKYDELLKLMQKENPVQELAQNSLALGYISKLKTIYIFEKMKKTFNISLYTEEVFHTLDASKLRTIDKTVELKGVRCAIHSIKSFENFFQLSEVRLHIYVDWESILDDASMLGRVLHLRGYLDKAYRAWKLVYNISTVLDDVLSQCRALSFFCENFNFIKDFDNEFNIENEIDLRSEKILHRLLDLQYLTPRKQNYVLLCILHISYFYSQINKYEISFNLLEMVNLKLNTLIERKNKFELVRATYHSIVFRLMTRGNYDYKFPVSPYYYAYQIIEQIKSVEYYTSEDAINFPLALYGIVLDIADYVSIRLCAIPIVPHIQMMLKFSIDNGCSYRIIQILSVWASINLQCEEVEKCETKLLLIDILLGNKNTDFVEMKKEMVLIPSKPNMLFDDFYDSQALEPIRKTAKYPPPIIKKNVTNHSYQYNLKDYLINHVDKCGCDVCRNTIIKWQSFQVGCLRARSLFLKDETDLLEDFFQNALKWKNRKQQNKHDKIFFNNMVFWFFVYYVNELRRKRRFKKAIDICEQATCFFDSHNEKFDICYRVNFMDQKACSVIKKKR